MLELTQQGAAFYWFAPTLRSSNGSAVAGKYAGFLIGRLLDCWVLDKKLDSTLSLTTHVYFNVAAATSNKLSPAFINTHGAKRHWQCGVNLSHAETKPRPGQV